MNRAFTCRTKAASEMKDSLDRTGRFTPTGRGSGFLRLAGKTACLLGAGFWVFASATAEAQVTWTATGTNSMTGQFLSASVSFDITNGNQLQVTLSNFGSNVMAASDVLGAVFFDAKGAGTLTTVSAVLNAGSVMTSPLPGVTTLGDWWDYMGGISGAPGGATYGIGAVGLGIFGQGDFGSNPQNVDGFDEGIINGSSATGNDHIPTTPLENNSVVFTLSGLPTGYNLSNISDVQFQYGTTLSETALPGNLVPEPSALALIGLAAVAMFARRGKVR